jgi:hypothetical protein
MAKKEPKLSTMGDVINLTFENDFNEDQVYELVDNVALTREVHQENFIELTSYPTTTRLSELYISSEEKHLKHLVNIEKSGRKGSLLHDILANAGNEKEVQTYIEGLVLQGIIKVDERVDLNARVMEVLANPDLKSILAKESVSITEKSIIDANGKLHRPDRVLIAGNEVTILDYKFTLEESNKHIEQINTYKNLLLEMGYEQVKGYLFYAVSGKLKLV